MTARSTANITIILAAAEVVVTVVIIARIRGAEFEI